MAGWQHWLNGRESQWTPGVGDGQGGLACCDSWGCKESDTTEQLIWSDGTKSNNIIIYCSAQIAWALAFRCPFRMSAMFFQQVPIFFLYFLNTLELPHFLGPWDVLALSYIFPTWSRNYHFSNKHWYPSLKNGVQIPRSTARCSTEMPLLLVLSAEISTHLHFPRHTVRLKWWNFLFRGAGHLLTLSSLKSC